MSVPVEAGVEKGRVKGSYVAWLLMGPSVPILSARGRGHVLVYWGIVTGAVSARRLFSSTS